MQGGGGLFGSKPAATGFGTAATGTGFNFGSTAQPQNTGLFAQKPAATGFSFNTNTSTSGFGKKNNTYSISIFFQNNLSVNLLSHVVLLFKPDYLIDFRRAASTIWRPFRKQECVWCNGNDSSSVWRVRHSDDWSVNPWNELRRWK